MDTRNLNELKTIHKTNFTINTPSRLVTVGEEDRYPPSNSIHKHIRAEIAHKNKQYIYIATFNTLTLRTNESLTELIIALSNIKWSIVGLSEVRRHGEAIEDHGNFIFYYNGVTPGQFGTGFLVQKALSSYIDEFIGISERITILNLKLPNTEMWSIMQIYSPTEQSNKTEIDDFYAMVTNSIKLHTHNNLIVMGDFNARTGNRVDGEEVVLGPYCSGKRTRNGRKLLHFAYENNLKILNSLFKSRDSNRWTWISPNGRYKNEIDYILSNKNKQFQDCRVINNLNFNSNHRMVRAKLLLNSCKKARPFKVKQTRKMTLDNNDNLKAKLNNFIECTKDLNTQYKYNKLEEILEHKTCISKKRQSTTKWLSNKTIELLRTRAELISLAKKTKRTRQQIAEISKEIKSKMRRDRQKYRLGLLKESIQGTGGIKKATKQLIGKVEWIPNISDQHKKRKTRRLEIMSIATEFFRNLYTKQNVSQLIDLTGGDRVPDILPAEVEKSIKTQKKDKAPGLDGIVNETLIENMKQLVPIFTSMFNEILQSEAIPEQWTISTIVLLYKKGDKNDINNYRPISLMSNIYKVFAKVILNRITKTLDECQPREQAGFRSGFSTIDHIHVVKQLFEKGREFNMTFYCCFIDYSKAFDSLEHNSIWQALKNQGVENQYIRILEHIYRNSKAKIKLEKEGKEIRIERGVRQGDPISPKLFTAVLEEVIRKLDWQDCGLKINGENLTHLRFADDLIIFSSSKEELQTMISSLEIESRKVGLIMNVEKTQAMTNGLQEQIIINNKIINYTDEYVYLGQIISPIDMTSKEIDRRIGHAWKLYWSQKEIMKNKEISIFIKRKLFDTCILPVLTYGCQTWSLNKNHLRKLEACQKAMERSMMGKKLSDRIRTVDIKKYTKTKDVTVTIKNLKWKWIGHTIRGKEKWSKTIMFWFTRDRNRKRGRPPRRWVDEIKFVAGGKWTRAANDRQKWRQLGEAFANRHTDIT